MRHAGLWAVVLLILAVAYGVPPAGARCGWVARAGGLVVVVGILVESWPILVTRRAAHLLFWTSPDFHDAVRHAILVTCTGTLVWAFGDKVCEVAQGAGLFN